MPGKSKKYLIAAEKHEIVIVRSFRVKTQGFCRECKTEVELFNLDLAVSVSGKRAREVLALIEAGEVHSFENKYGHLLVCCNSLEGAKR